MDAGIHRIAGEASCHGGIAETADFIRIVSVIETGCTVLESEALATHPIEKGASSAPVLINIMLAIAH